jgi:hypothetical protein
VQWKASILAADTYTMFGNLNVSMLTYQVVDLVSKLQISPSTPITAKIPAGMLKVRHFNIKNNLPFSDIDNGQLQNIINLAWKTQFNLIQDGLTVGHLLAGQPFVSHVLSVSRRASSQSELVYRIDYTVALNNNDPQVYGISDPTYSEFQRAFGTYQQAGLLFYAAESYNYGRVYVYQTVDNTDASMANTVASAWNVLNPDYSQLGNRVQGNIALDNGFFDSNGLAVTRVSYQWTVDGADPNPVFFSIPTAANIDRSLLTLNLPSYTGEPYKLYSFYMSNAKQATNNKRSDERSLLESAISNAWSTDNQNFKFVVSNINFAKLAVVDVNGLV